MEKVINSFIDNRIHFTLDQMNCQRLIRLRRANIEVTCMIWITMSPRYDKILNEFYNPKSPILLFLN